MVIIVKASTIASIYLGGVATGVWLCAWFGG